ncbi:hypothetical protein L0244_41065 [bacterium]|nr:hypothetical protein [bacterium]MCI0619404.1 hypothetical protein [bacterium]
MSKRIQVILDEEEALQFKNQARKEGKSVSSWLREAGRKILELNDSKRKLKDPASLKNFFQKINSKKDGTEPDWEEHKKLVSDGYRNSVP